MFSFCGALIMYFMVKRKQSLRSIFYVNEPKCCMDKINLALAACCFITFEAKNVTSDKKDKNLMEFQIHGAY